MAKNTGKVREFCQSGEVGTLREDLVIQNVYLISKFYDHKHGYNAFNNGVRHMV